MLNERGKLKRKQIPFNLTTCQATPLASHLGTAIQDNFVILKKMRLPKLALLLLVTTSSLAVEETVNYGQVRCGKVKLRCTMKVSFKCDCSEVIKVTPKCTGSKKAK